MATSASGPLALSMGEPAGIGPDLILQLYADRQAHSLPAFIVYGDVAFLRRRARRLGLDILVAAETADQAASVFPDALPVLDLGADLPDTPGEIDDDAAPVVIEAIRRAVSDVQAGSCRALVTAPIHKAALYSAGFSHPGHTEFLADLCAAGGKTPLPVMMLAHDDLRTVPVTIHIPLAEVPRALTPDLLTETIRIVDCDLKTRFGIAAPKIGVTGLNPHAGEDGAIGREEIDLIIPALNALRAEDLDIDGPLPADTVFYPPHWRRYDCVVAMYHDQALIPIKTIGFEDGVNVTLGLPIVRTSPDHGTAFSLAGTGSASVGSLLAAIRLADSLS